MDPLPKRQKTDPQCSSTCAKEVKKRTYTELLYDSKKKQKSLKIWPSDDMKGQCSYIA